MKGFFLLSTALVIGLPFILFAENEVKDIELAGMVIDETRTKVGMDFYEMFFTDWEEQKLTLDAQLSYDIKITEKPLPRQGSQISVFIIILFQEHIIYKSFVRPRYEDLKNATRFAAGNAKNFIQNYKRMQEQLYGDDLAGSGIF